METKWHVAGSKWGEGDDLCCWEDLESAGIVTEEDWHWDEAPVGFDGDVVCVHGSLEDAIEYQSEHGGTIVQIDIPDEDDDCFDTRVVAEGYLGIRGTIYAEYLTVIR